MERLLKPTAITLGDAIDLCTGPAELTLDCAAIRLLICGGARLIYSSARCCFSPFSPDKYTRISSLDGLTGWPPNLGLRVAQTTALAWTRSAQAPSDYASLAARGESRG